MGSTAGRRSGGHEKATLPSWGPVWSIRYLVTIMCASWGVMALHAWSGDAKHKDACGKLGLDLPLQCCLLPLNSFDQSCGHAHASACTCKGLACMLAAWDSRLAQRLPHLPPR